MEPRMQPIVIAGAGIGGLSAALALALEGFSVEVFERASAIREVGAGIQLGPNAFRVFTEWSLDDRMEEIAFAPHAIRFRDSTSGREIFRQELGASFLGRFGHPYRVAYRADVQRVLLDALDSHPSVKLHTGNGVRRFAENDGALLVTTDRDGTIPAAALIGADGLWSEVRQAIVGDGKPLEHGHVAYRAVIPTASLAGGLATDDVQIWVGSGHHLVCYKLRRGELFNVVAIIESPANAEGWDNAPDLAQLEASFVNACAPLRELLPLLRHSRLWVLRDRAPVKDWSRGAATLLGDAAHPALPYLAQGACMAIEDARCLAEHFARGAPWFPAACRAYEHARIARTARIQSAAREMGRLNHLSGEAARARDAALAARDPEDHDGSAWIFDGAEAATSGAGASFFGSAP
jgi:2-polyprenyl-6-methoxyphenol hydroxylase-like FAD-dependent oxidoreductase